MPAVTPYARMLATAEVAPAKKAEMTKLHGQLNPLALAIQRRKKEINGLHLLRA